MALHRRRPDAPGRTLLARVRRARHALAVARALPPRVLLFYLRARRLSVRSGDVGAAIPRQVGKLLEVAGSGDLVVELGTGKAWTAIALALARPTRRVISYDLFDAVDRDRYLALAPAAARSRIDLRRQRAEDGPSGESDVDMLFIDSSHEVEETVTSFTVWEPAVRSGGAVVFHDYGNPDYPGVEEGVRQLGLEGEVRQGLFIWRKP